jgi:hypothetical protein
VSRCGLNAFSGGSRHANCAGNGRESAENHKEREMKYTERMMQSSPNEFTGGVALTACIDACFECEQACTTCADACLGEPEPQHLVFCIRRNLDCADLCGVTGRILSRHSTSDSALLHQLLQSCAEACRMCAEECERHGGMGMEHCAVCAEACRTCEKACEHLMTRLAS